MSHSVFRALAASGLGLAENAGCLSNHILLQEFAVRSSFCGPVRRVAQNMEGTEFLPAQSRSGARHEDSNFDFRMAANTTAAKSDGTVTKAERVKLRREAERNSKVIYKQKHDGQTAAPAAAK